MKTVYILISKNIEEDYYYFNEFQTKEQAIKRANELENRIICSHDILGIFKEKKNNHKWQLQIWRNIDLFKDSTITLHSKKSIKLAEKIIRKHEPTINSLITKIY